MALVSNFFRKHPPGILNKLLKDIFKIILKVRQHVGNMTRFVTNRPQRLFADCKFLYLANPSYVFKGEEIVFMNSDDYVKLQ